MRTTQIQLFFSYMDILDRLNGISFLALTIYFKMLIYDKCHFFITLDSVVGVRCVGYFNGLK